MAFAATAMDACSPPTEGVGKVNKDFTLPRDMSWNSDDNMSIVMNDELSDGPTTYHASNQGGFPGNTDFILEVYQFYFPNAGTVLSEKDRMTLRTLLSNSSYTLKYVLVRSYTDKTGSSDVNEKIATERADAVRKEAIARGVAPEMFCAEIIADRWNEEHEQARDNKTESDRRVEIYVYFNRWRS